MGLKQKRPKGKKKKKVATGFDIRKSEIFRMCCIKICGTGIIILYLAVKQGEGSQF